MPTEDEDKQLEGLIRRLRAASADVGGSSGAGVVASQETITEAIGWLERLRNGILEEDPPYTPLKS